MPQRDTAALPRGMALLRDPYLNKSCAFSEIEREQLGLTGLLPEAIDSEEAQIRRILGDLDRKSSDLERYIYLCGLQNDDETLFYRLLRADLPRFLPLVYTPTVGEACLEFSHITRRPRGLYISIKRKGRVREVLRNWPERDVRIIVVTSGERILGLGDLGANGMGIPIGKLSLYSACGGVPPQLTMPVTLDCGTNNETLLQDPLYLGLRQTRPPAADVDEFVEEFVTAVAQEFPDCCIQFEDWGRADAFRLLSRYRDRVCCFNDDSQGSGAVALAGILSALRITGGKLRDQSFLFLGAGQAAVGIAELLARALASEGLSLEDARARSWLFNRRGLIESTRPDLTDFQQPYAHSHAPQDSFLAAVDSIKPASIIGASTMAKAFNRQVVEAMARINRRPIIFALSNPTSRSECTAQEAYSWSEGRAVFASGSPFAPVRLGNRSFTSGQCNNMYIFPAIGLAAYATRARRITNEMFVAAARAVAEMVTDSDLDAGCVYPRLSAIFETELHVAERVAAVMFARALAGVAQPGDLRSFIQAWAYLPRYGSLV
jgi:malate dehydrogenase (oxaloacetate-decarboxylating)(NADP+)